MRRTWCSSASFAFLDPPKETTRDAIHALREYGVGVKILTGDNEKVTCAICRQVGLNAERVLLGADIDAMDDETLAQAAEEITVFAKLSPAQKRASSPSCARRGIPWAIWVTASMMQLR